MDRRFAIIIGINDYAIKSLEYCVNDAISVSEILKQKCSFNQDDIFMITSDSINPTKDISGHLDNALRIIGERLVPRQDSIFFYFAGHGQYHFEKSGLLFHDSLTLIVDIYNRLNNLQPKYQCFVIDACESGGKVLTRGSTKVDLLENYLAKSEGVLFMYAATEDEKAKELKKINHGLFTYYFLKAIDDDSLYDSDGILTPNRIQDYIARETSKESEFKQTPVIENRTIGYYPFAYKNGLTLKESTVIEEVNIEKIRTGSSSLIDITYFPFVPPEIRKRVFEEILDALKDAIKQISNDLILEDYELLIGNSLSIFSEAGIEDELTDSIVNKARNEKIDSIESVFSSERTENVHNPFFGTLSMLQAFSNKRPPKYSYHNSIFWDDKNIVGYSFYLKSKNIYKASCGIIVAIYQAVYGIGVAKSSFYLDFTGEKDTKLNGPFTKIYCFKVHGGTSENVNNLVQSEFAEFGLDIDEWNSKRENSISTFSKKAR